MPQPPHQAVPPSLAHPYLLTFLSPYLLRYHLPDWFLDGSCPPTCLTPDTYLSIGPKMAPDGKHLVFLSHATEFIGHSTCFEALSRYRIIVLSQSTHGLRCGAWSGQPCLALLLGCWYRGCLRAHREMCSTAYTAFITRPRTHSTWRLIRLSHSLYSVVSSAGSAIHLAVWLQAGVSDRQRRRPILN